MRLVLIIFVVALLMVICNVCHAQIYSSSTSHEVLSIVSTETPEIKIDTLVLGGMPPYFHRIRHTYSYKKVIVILIESLDIDWMLSTEWNWRCNAYTREGTRVMLIPDEEFAILEKLLTLIKKK